MKFKRAFKSRYYKTYETARFYGASPLGLFTKKVSIRRLKQFEKAFLFSIKGLSEWANGIEARCIEAQVRQIAKCTPQ